MAAIIPIEPVDEIVFELFRQHNPKVSVPELREVVRELQTIGGVESNWIILLLISYKWDIESLRAVLLSWKAIDTFTDNTVPSNPSFYNLRSMQYCVACERETLYVRGDCFHHLCTVCVSSAVLAALETNSLPVCHLCAETKFLNPIFILSTLGPEVCVRYKTSLVKKIDAFHSIPCKFTRFLWKRKVVVVGFVLAGVALTCVILKVKGEVEIWTRNHPVRAQIISDTAKISSAGEKLLKPGNLWKICKNALKKAWDTSFH